MNDFVTVPWSSGTVTGGLESLRLSSDVRKKDCVIDMQL